jgi:hypothetical protein
VAVTVVYPTSEIQAVAPTPRPRPAAARPPVPDAAASVGQTESSMWPGVASHAGDTSSHRDPTASAPARRPSAPGAPPSGPLGFLAAISAAFASSAALLYVAALAAALLPAAPGLSRRLRLGLAPWPLPIPLGSLERPG